MLFEGWICLDDRALAFYVSPHAIERSQWIDFSSYIIVPSVLCHSIFTHIVFVCTTSSLTSTLQHICGLRLSSDLFWIITWYYPSNVSWFLDHFQILNFSRVSLNSVFQITEDISLFIITLKKYGTEI